MSVRTVGQNNCILNDVIVTISCHGSKSARMHIALLPGHEGCFSHACGLGTRLTALSREAFQRSAWVYALWGKIIAFLSHHAKNFPCICGTKDSNDNPQLKLLHPLQGRFKTCNVLETFRNCYFGHSHSLPVCISHVCLQELITHLVNKIGIHRERQYVTVVPYMVLKLTRYWPVSYGWPSKGHISFSDCFRGLHCCSPSSST